MNSLDFLKVELEKISKKFKAVHIKYGFNKAIRMHIVELLPLTEYLHNDTLSEAWMPLSFEFGEQFPNEEISFVSSDSTLSIQVPTFEFNIPAPFFGDISTFYAPISQQEFNYSFPEAMPKGGIAIGASIVEVLNSPKQEIDTTPDMTNYYLAAA
jgi:hypothetical protein